MLYYELLGASWGNDGTNGIYGMAGCSQVEVDTGAAGDVQWGFTQEPAATALWPPRSWQQVTGAGGALPLEAREDLDGGRAGATLASARALIAPPVPPSRIVDSAVGAPGAPPRQARRAARP